MNAETLNLVSLGLGAIGFACFAWPIMQRFRGQAEAEPLGSGRSLRSPMWWAGFVLTVAAIFLQRIASQQMAGG